jgi:dipeptidyl aminopeptidase/acylaminoacyl peptidase
MQVPRGEGPFPVVILNHGYIPPSQYVSGSDTWRPADHLARNGFLTLAPDFRGWAGSTSGSNYFRTGLVIDALNLISSLDSIPQADTRYIGMWGHSMGGGVTLTSLVVDSRIDAAVLYAPVSGDFADNYEKWGDANSEAMGEGDTVRDLYVEAVEDANYVRQVSPINYLKHVQAPVQIHQGTVDVTTPPGWAEAIAEGLSAAEKDIEYFAYEGQNHAFQGAAWRLFLDRITAFYDAELRE